MEVARLSAAIDLESSSAERNAKSFERQWKETTDEVNKGFNLAAGFTAFQAGLGAVQRLFGAVKGAAIDMNAQLESSTLQFATLMGSATKAQEHVADLFEYAKETPFETQPIIEASRMLETFGGTALNTKDNIRLIGDASAAVQAPIQDLGFWIGRLYSNIKGGQPFGEAAMRLQELAVLGPEARQQMEALQKAGASNTEVWEIFRKELERFTGATKLQASSWSGLTSTFTDSVNILMSRALRPLFDVAKEVLSGINALLDTEAVEQWADRFAKGLTTIIYLFKDFGTLLQPSIKGLTDFVATLASANPQKIGQAFQDAFKSAGRSIEEFGRLLLGSGYTAVENFVKGFLAAANTQVVSALNQFNQLILTSLQSFAPQMFQAGSGVASNWIAGFLPQLRTVSTEAQKARDEMVAADKAARMDEAQTSLPKVENNLKALETQGQALDKTLRGIDKQLKAMDDTSRNLRWEIEDIQQAYREQLDPLERQLDTLKNTRNYQREMGSLVRELQLLEVERAEEAARGDRVQRERLEATLREVDYNQNILSLTERREEVLNRLSGKGKSEAQQRLEQLNADERALRMREREEDIKKRMAKDPAAKKEWEAFQREKERYELENQIAEERKQEDARREASQRRRDELELQALDAQIELQQVGDRHGQEQLAQIRSNIDANSRVASIEERRERILRDIAALPLEEQIEGIRRAQEETIKPLEERQRLLNREREQLQAIRGEWAGMKADISEATEEAKKAQVSASTDPMSPANKPKADVNAILGQLDTQNKAAEERGRNLAISVTNAFTTYLRENWGTALGGVVGGLLGAVFGPAGIVAGATLGTTIGASLQSTLQAAGFDPTPVITTISDSLKRVADEGIVPSVAKWTDEFVEWVKGLWPDVEKKFNEFKTDLTNWIGQQQGAFTSQMAIWVPAFVEWVASIWPLLDAKLTEWIGQLLQWIGAKYTELVGAFIDWTTAFVEWLTPVLPPMLEEAGKLFVGLVDWIASKAGPLLDGLGEWAVQFVDFIAPKIPGMLEAMNKFLGEMTLWMITTALPAIVKQTTIWGAALVDWLIQRIPGLLANLTRWDNELRLWLANQLVTILAETKKWANAFIQWILDLQPRSRRAMTDLSLELGRQLFNIGQKVIDSGVEIGSNVVRGIWSGVSKMSTWLWDQLTLWTENWIPLPIRKALGIASPSKEAEDIGIEVVKGIPAGLRNAVAVGEMSTAANELGASIINSIRSGVMSSWSGDEQNLGLESFFATLGQKMLDSINLGLTQIVTNSGLTIQDGQTAAGLALFPIGQQLMQGMLQGLIMGFGSIDPENDEQVKQGQEQTDKQMQTVLGWFAETFGPEGTLITQLLALNPAQTLFTVGQHLAEGVRLGLQQGFFGTLENDAGFAALGDSAKQSIQQIVGAAQGVGQGGEQGGQQGGQFQSIIDWFTQTFGPDGTLVQALLALQPETTLFPIGQKLMQGLYNGMLSVWLGEEGAAAAGIAAAAGAAGGSAMGDLVAGGILPWLQSIPSQIRLALDSDDFPAIELLYDIGWDVMSGFWNGAIDEWMIQEVWWGMIGYNIQNAILMGGTIYIVQDIGKQVMAAFGKGVEDEWRFGPKLFFDRMGDEIRRSADSWPPDELLAPAGKKLMEGLTRAIEQGSKQVLDKIRELGKQIKSAMEEAVEEFQSAADKANEAAGQIEAAASRAVAAAQQLQSAMLSVSSFSFGGGGGFSGVTGFADGGILREPVIGFGTRSGQAYTFAERGPEAFVPLGMRNSVSNPTVSNMGSGRGGDGGTYYYVTIQAGSVIAEKDLVYKVRDGLLKLQTRNVTTGIRGS